MRVWQEADYLAKSVVYPASSGKLMAGSADILPLWQDHGRIEGGFSRTWPMNKVAHCPRAATTGSHADRCETARTSTSCVRDDGVESQQFRINHSVRGEGADREQRGGEQDLRVAEVQRE